MRHLLRLDPLDEPTEEVEVTRRGMTVHRALARLHLRLRDEGRDRPAREVEADIHHEMRRAVDEDIARAPGPASRALWRLEGERLLRSTKRYNAQWAKFVEPWNKLGVAPTPHLFEADFGLPVPEGQTPYPPLVIHSEGVEVRISGRIDRVDLAPLDDGLGFWIIDYKTGSGSHYTGPALATFRKLQLTLYALAVEEVFLADQGARPLGLAYWLVGDTGSKVALPMRKLTQWREDPQRWLAVREALRRWVARLATNIRRGAFPLAPRSEDCTATCEYGTVCRIGQSRSVGKVFDLPLPGGEG
jgi:RecB family exonuclease